MRNANEIKSQIDQALAEIETLAKKARFENANLDTTARDIAGLANVVKDLNYTLRTLAVLS